MTSPNNKQPTNINYTELDFDALKRQLIAYLQGQEQFRDYDFTGASLNVLLDLLAYNSAKNAFFVNQLHSEAHLDSAQLYSSVISHSKDLNYTPGSSKSAKARVRVNFKATKESQPYIIPKGSTFTTLVKNRSYVFSTPATLALSSPDAEGNYAFETDIYEGIYLPETFVFSVTNADEIPRFRLSNPNVDTSSITVVVYENGDVIGDNYALSETLLDVNQYSKVFFLQGAEDGSFEILFGDGVIGRRPAAGAQILVDYRVSNGPAGNGASAFAINFDPTATSAANGSEIVGVPTITTLVQANSGANRESIESIRYYAPRHFQVQQRGVIGSDYEIMLKTQFPEINAVSAYGGELATPPKFGKVFIAIDIQDVEDLPDSKIKEYKAFLKGRNVFGIDPIFVSPEYTFLRVDTLVRYNLNLTTSTPENIKTLVNSALAAYNVSELNDFGVIARGSVISSVIDAADGSIVSNQTTIRPFKNISPATRSNADVNISFNLALRHDFGSHGTSFASNDLTCLTSSDFVMAGSLVSLRDDGRGVIHAVSLRGNTYVSNGPVGAINYDTGAIQLKAFNIDRFIGDAISIFVTPVDLDIQVDNKNIAAIDPAQTNITVQAIRL